MGDTTDMVVMDLVSMDARRETMMPNQKENLMLTLGCTIPPTDTGHHGTPDTTDMVVMDLVSTDARREKLMLFLRLTPTLKHTTIYMVTGQQDTMVTIVLMDGTTGIALANKIMFEETSYCVITSGIMFIFFQNFITQLKLLSKYFNLVKT